MSIRTILTKLNIGIRRIENALLVFCAVLFMALVFLGTGDVCGRFLFNKPIVGALEMSTVMMGAIILLGWAYTQNQNGHVRVQLFLDMFPPRVQTILTFVSLIISLILFIVITQQSWNIAMTVLQEGRRFTLIDFPKGPFLFLVPVGGFLICLEFIIQLFEIAPKMRKG